MVARGVFFLYQTARITAELSRSFDRADQLSVSAGPWGGALYREASLI